MNDALAALASLSILHGLAVGDALGVPVEFISRTQLKQNPVKDMRGYGTHSQPPGTWSDDSALAFCLAATIAKGFNLQELANRFVKWYRQGYWSATGEVFDIGIATAAAISRLENGCEPTLAGGTGERDNGNGSLMRIAPLALHVLYHPIESRFETTRQVSALTHGHIRSAAACIILVEFLRLLILNNEMHQSYELLSQILPQKLTNWGLPPEELQHFNRIFSQDIRTLSEDEIQSDGYVIHTLEASLWCLLTTRSYEQAVLKAVNLGHDADTTGAVTGALAGMAHQIDTIPIQWLNQVARSNDINNLSASMIKNISTVKKKKP
jgi:ADP-ribosyl-[dinitrogen reductase] hydrolase